ncbi:MAG: PRC-barrel domain-containing protein [Pseudomonadota bacterium]
MLSKKKAMAVLAAASLVCAGLASAQAPSTQSKTTTTTTATPVAGQSTIGVAVVEMESVIAGWSVAKDILKKNVLNDKKEKIGTISDIVITPNPDARLPSASYAIIGVGGFAGIGKHDVAIPMQQIKLQHGSLVLAGATKDALKALPKFEYRRR